ncbi:MAG TPA: hypothetical protein VGH16_17225 [Candidatus Binatia bacterium]
MSARIIKAALIAQLLLLLPSPAPAAEITLDVTVGYHGVFQLGRPFPIKIEVTNTGPPVEGTVEATVWKGGGPKGIGAFPVHHRRNLLIGAAARKTATFIVDPGSVSRPLVVSFHAPGAAVTQELDLRRHFVPSAIVLLLTESDFSVLPGLSTPANPLVAIAPEELPSDPRAYGGVAAVVLYEPSLREISGAQNAALETWLVCGGKIVALGSLRYSLYQEAALGRFLPVKVSGLKRFAALPELAKRYGVPPVGAVEVQDATITDGRAVVAEHGSPIVVEAERGKGKIVYLAVDIGRPPFSKWDGAARLLKDLVAAPAENFSAPAAAWDDAVFSQLLLNRAVSSMYLPVGAFAGCIVGYLLVLAALTWCWDRRRLAPRTLGGGFLTVVFLSSSMGYFYFSRADGIPDGVLVTSTLLDALPNGAVEASSNAALFSTIRRDYDVFVEKGWTDFDPLPRRSVLPDENGFTIEEEGGRPRLRMALKAWDYRLFRLRSVARLPVRVELAAEADRRLVKVSNNSAQDLADCWAVVSGQILSLGDIPAGRTRSRELPYVNDPAAVGGRAYRSGLRDVHFKDPVRELLLRYSYFPQEQTNAWAGAGLFFGWLQGAPRGVTVADVKVREREYAFFRAAFPVGGEDE